MAQGEVICSSEPNSPWCFHLGKKIKIWSESSPIYDSWKVAPDPDCPESSKDYTGWDWVGQREDLNRLEQKQEATTKSIYTSRIGEQVMISPFNILPIISFKIQIEAWATTALQLGKLPHQHTTNLGRANPASRCMSSLTERKHANCRSHSTYATLDAKRDHSSIF